MDIITVRNLFPHIKTGRIYFNHAATSPLSQPVIDAIKFYVTEKSEGSIDNYMDYLKTLDGTKQEVADLIGADKDRIAFLDNTSNGLNVLAQGISWSEGDRIILNDVEFPANVYPFLNLGKMGVKIDMVKSRNGIVRAEDIIEVVKPCTKLISVSQVQFLSGYRIDLKTLGDYCKDKGIILAVDAIQGVGALKLNVNELNIGFVSCGTQKWMMGLLGLSFIYLSEDLQSKLEQKFVGWTSVENAWDFLNYDLKLKKSASAFENGTLNALGIYALEEAIKLFDAYGYDKVEETVINNSIYIMKRLESIGINSILSKCQKEFLSGIVSFYHPDNERIFEELSKRKISCSLREKMIRLSPHFYNTEEEIDVVVDELKKILNYKL